MVGKIKLRMLQLRQPENYLLGAKTWGSDDEIHCKKLQCILQCFTVKLIE